MVNNARSSADTRAPRTFVEVIGISAAMRTLRRRGQIMLAIGALGATAAFLVVMTRPVTYTAVSQLLVTPRQSAAHGPASASSIDSEVELLRSPALMNELSQGLTERGDTNPEFAAQSLVKEITVARRGVTNVVEIAANSRTGPRAQQIANTYADIYIANQLRVHVGASTQASSWLARRLGELRDDVTAKENAAEAYRVQAGIPSADAPQEQAPVAADLTSQIQLAQADYDEKQNRANRLRDLGTGASVESLAGVVSSETLTALRDRMADIDRRQADLENRYLPTHPAVIAVRAERDTVQAQIDREAQRAAADVAAQAASARARLQALQAQRARTPATLRPTQAADADAVDRFHELQRVAADARQAYETYRNQEMPDVNDLDIPDIRVLAYAPTPSSPSSPLLRDALLLAAAVGLGLAFVSGILAEMLDQSVKNADHLEERVGCKAVASIPTISKRMMRQMPPAERHPPGYLVGRPMSAFAEALRVLRTVVVYSKLDFSVKVVAVTSALPNEGKTTIALCLARIAALSGQKVCVVDCDLRMQSINDVIDIETDVGILQVLAGEAPWRSAIIRDPSTEAHILPVATSGFTPRDVFGSEAMSQLIANLRSYYDLVILDCAPILAVAETRILVAQADSTVLVARSGRTPVGALRAAVAQTETAGGKVLGVALNYVLPHWQTFSDSLYFNDSKSYYSVS